MRILNGTCETQLAAEMLCLEHGARAVGPDLAPLPPPHAPWPLIAIPPATKAAVPYSVHYRPAVGIVFYTRPAGFDVSAFVHRVRALLARASDAHLRGYRACAASPAAVLRYKGRAREGASTIIAGPRAPPVKLPRAGGVVPARLLLFTPPDHIVIPRHWSVAAVFTWVFMPIEVALKASLEGYSGAANANALVAGLVFDAASILGAPLAPRDIDTLTPTDLGCVPLPAGFDPAPILQLCGPRAPGALVIDGATVTFAGSYRNMRRQSAQDTATRALEIAVLPVMPWDEVKAADTCVICHVPLAGTVVVARQMRSAPNLHNQMFPPGYVVGQELNVAVAFCRFCCPPMECLRVHMGGACVRAVVPRTLAEACAAYPAYAPLAPLLTGVVHVIPNVANAYSLETKTYGEIVLAGGALGAFPTIACPAVGALRLPAFSQLNLISVAAPIAPLVP